MTIEDRANTIAIGIYSGWDTERIRQLERAAIACATEQDKIARQEERERCINVVQDFICYEFCTSVCTALGGRECEIHNRIRKAMEE